MHLYILFIYTSVQSAQKHVNVHITISAGYTTYLNHTQYLVAGASSLDRAIFSLVTQQVRKPTEAASGVTRCPACRASAPPVKVMFLPLVPPTTTPGCSDTCLASGLPQCMLSLRPPLTAPPSAPPLPAALRTALAAHCPLMRLTAVCPGPLNTNGTM
jgi:hypothetical protein